MGLRRVIQQEIAANMIHKDIEAYANEYIWSEWTPFGLGKQPKPVDPVRNVFANRGQRQYHLYNREHYQCACQQDTAVDQAVADLVLEFDSN